MTREDNDVRHVQRIRRFTAAAAVAGAVALAAGACAKGDSSAEPATTAAAATAPTTPPTTVNQAEKDKADIKAVLNAYWSELAIAVDPPDPERAQLLDTVVGNVRQNIQSFLADLKAKGWRARRQGGGPSPHSISNFDVAGDSAQTLECVIDDNVTVDGNGGVVSDEVYSFIYRTTISRQSDGRWAISERKLEDRKPGKVLCPAL